MNFKEPEFDGPDSEYKECNDSASDFLLDTAVFAVFKEEIMDRIKMHVQPDDLPAIQSEL